jgi:hypothetical protein
MLNRIICVAAVMLATLSEVWASDSLLYIETQMVTGYSSLNNKLIYYSMDQEQAMQKPSVGIDYIKNYSSDYGDWGELAFQGRAAYDDTYNSHIETQIYNAFFKLKLDYADIWVGHHKPAFGLNSILDTHGTLLQTLTAEGLGFESDWGAGAYKVFDDADLNFTLTSGSGFELYDSGNYLACTRYSYGILNKDNYTFGVSLNHGQIYDMMDYHRVYDYLFLTSMAGVDFSWNIRYFEFKFESTEGTMGDYQVNGTLIRIGYNLLEENRLKLELQPTLSKTVDEGQGYKIYFGVSYTLNEYLALRTMYEYDHFNGDHSVIGQVYYYRKI